MRNWRHFGLANNFSGSENRNAVVLSPDSHREKLLRRKCRAGSGCWNWDCVVAVILRVVNRSTPMVGCHGSNRLCRNTSGHLSLRAFWRLTVISWPQRERATRVARRLQQDWSRAPGLLRFPPCGGLASHVFLRGLGHGWLSAAVLGAIENKIRDVQSSGWRNRRLDRLVQALVRAACLDDDEGPTMLISQSLTDAYVVNPTPQLYHGQAAMIACSRARSI